VDIDRAVVVATILEIRGAVMADRVGGLIDPILLWEDRVWEIVRRACEHHALSLDRWAAILSADADLARLLDRALDEVLGDPPDPGPYDVISREAACGCVMPVEEALQRDARLLGRVGR
jgi:hypothetical protein